MQISVKSNVRSVAGFFKAANDGAVKTAVRNTLNDVAKQVTRQNVPGGLRNATSETFTKKSGQKGATNHTRTGFFYDRANKQNLTAFVYWDQKRGKYMNLQTYGGQRRPKSRYIVIPNKKHGRTLMDGHGNMRWDRYTQLKRNKDRYFEGRPAGKPRGAIGLWERYPANAKPEKQRVRQIAAYEERTSYRPLFKFEGTVRGYVEDRKRGFTPQLQVNLRKALRRLNKRRGGL